MTLSSSVRRPTIDEILTPKPEARLRIYAWTPNDPPAAYVGLIKIGQTTQENVNDRIRQSQGQMQQAYTLHVDVFAEREDGTIFRDADVRQRLIDKKFENIVIGSSREWMRCSPDDVKTVGVDVLRHRVIPTYEAEAEEISSEDIIKKIFDEVEVP